MLFSYQPFPPLVAFGLESIFWVGKYLLGWKVSERSNTTLIIGTSGVRYDLPPPTPPWVLDIVLTPHAGHAKRAWSTTRSLKPLEFQRLSKSVSIPKNRI